MQQNISRISGSSGQAAFAVGSFSKLDVVSSKTTVEISGADFAFVFDTSRGLLMSLAARSHSLLEPDPRTGAAVMLSFWRPGTDKNVSGDYLYWQRFGVDSLTSQLRSIQVDTSRDGIVAIKTTTFITPPVLAWGWECDIEYVVQGNGRLQILVRRLEPAGSFPKHVPRIGLNLRLNKALEHVQWLGKGPGESYPDKQSS